MWGRPPIVPVVFRYIAVKKIVRTFPLLLLPVYGISVLTILVRLNSTETGEYSGQFYTGTLTGAESYRETTERGV